MVNYVVPSNIFGFPNSGLTETTGRETQRTLGDVGRSQYTQYNRTAPVAVDLSFDWNGAQFNQFRDDWRDRDRWGWGSQWMQMDLPLMLDDTLEANTTRSPYRIDRQVFGQIKVGIAGDADLCGYHAGTPIGEITPTLVQGYDIVRFTTFVSSGSLWLRFGNQVSERLRIASEPLSIAFPGTGEEVPMGFFTDRYSGNLSNNAPAAYALMTTLDEEIPFIVQFKAQNEQRYQVHPTGTYSSTKIGFDHWRVTIPIEVDMSPKLYPVLDQEQPT